MKKKIPATTLIGLMFFFISVFSAGAQSLLNPTQLKINHPFNGSAVNLTTFTSKYSGSQSLKATDLDNAPIPQDIHSNTAIEIIAKRTNNTRYFIDKDTASKFYIVKASGDINYKKDGQWLTIDKRLQQVSKNLFEASYQQEPVGFDVNKKQGYIKTTSGIIYFNNWQLIGKNNNNETVLAQADWAHFTAGDDGIKIENIFPGIDAEMVVKKGAVKTNFIVRENQFSGYEQLLLSDEFQAGASEKLVFTDGGSENEKVAAVDVVIGQQNVARIDKAVMYAENDPTETAKLIKYNIIASHLRLVIKTNDLNNLLKKGYVVIDPLVSSTASLDVTNITGSKGNCSPPIQTCNYDLQVQTPAKATFTRIAMQFGFIAHYPARLRDGYGDITLGACSTGYFGIDPTLPDSIKNKQGTVSTSGMWSDIPMLLPCLPPPACVPQTVDFTLEFLNTVCDNTITGCSNVYVSAEESFQILIEGRTLEMNTLSPPDTLCQGGNTTLSATGIYGVPPYTYSWDNGGGAGSSVTVTPATTTNYTVTITDQCNNTVDSSSNIVVIPAVAPSVTLAAAGSLCTGTDTLVLTTHIPTSAAQLEKIIWYNGSTLDHINRGANIDTTFIPASPGKYSAAIITAAGCMSTVDSIMVNLGLQASVSITASATSFCTGDTINFTVTAVNGGTTPVYQWQLNGINVGTNSANYQDITLHDSDVITCKLTTNVNCAIPPTVTSNSIKISKGGTRVPYAYIVNDLTNSIDVVNLSTNTLATNIPVDNYPIYALSNTNRNCLYVTYSNKYITVINTITNTVVSTIPVFGAGFMCLSPDGSKLYVSADTISGTNNVSYITVINTATNAITTTITSHTGVSGEYGSMCISPDGSKLYVAINEGNIDVINTTTDLIESIISTPFPIHNLIINSAGNELYMSSDGNFVTAINISTNAITNIPLPEYTAEGLILSPDNSKLYVAVDDMIVTINTATNSVINMVQPDGVGVFQADGINISADGSQLYFSDYRSQSLKILNLTSNTVTGQVGNVGQPFIVTGLLDIGNAGVQCPPIITAFNSTTVCGSKDTVTITGHDLTGVFYLSFGGIGASYFKVINDSTIKALPNNGTSGNVSVTNAGGMDTLAGFTYIIPVVPSVTITANPSDTICAGSTITFTATPINGGLAPVYQWQINNHNVGTNNPTYSSATLSNQDTVSCILTSSEGCVVPRDTISNKIVVTVNPILTPAISIVASGNNICNGTPITFTATSSNGGTARSYQWQVNGVNVGANSISFTSDTLKNGDNVTCINK